MYFLFLETATAVCSVAISRNSQLLGYRDKGGSLEHSIALPVMIRDLMEEHGLKMADLKGVAVSSGPGSYTGLRVGGSTAKAIAYTLGIALIAVPTLEALAYAGFEHQPNASICMPMMDARRMEVYSTAFDSNYLAILPTHAQILDEDEVMSGLPSTGSIVVCGDGAKKAQPFFKDQSRVTMAPDVICSARHLVRPALLRWETGRLQDPLHYVPDYLKPPNITQAKFKV